MSFSCYIILFHTLLIVFIYFHIGKLYIREPLAQSAFSDIFLNYTFCLAGAAAIGYVPSKIIRKRQQTGVYK
ncbi:MAG: DUF6608 family protein [Roseburia sp. 1XD42-69]